MELRPRDQFAWDCDVDFLLAHPTLKRITLCGAEITCSTAGLPKRTTALLELVLLCCDFSSITLASILSAPKSLRRLTMKGPPRNLPYPRYLLVDAPPYIAEMKAHRSSLELIDFDLFNITESSGLLLDFRPFTALQHLVIRPEVLYGTTLPNLPLEDCSLPPTLNKLTFWWNSFPISSWYQRNVVRDINRWKTQGHLPGLRHLAFETPLPARRRHRSLEAKLLVTWGQLKEISFFPSQCWCCEYHLSAQGRGSFWSV